MDESYFFHSLQQLKLQLDLMNQRTAALLNPSPLLPTPNMSSQSGTIPWHIHQVGAKLDDLKCHLDSKFENLDSRLDALSDRLDDLDVSHFTPPESPASTVDNDASIRHSPLDACSVTEQPTSKQTHAAKPAATVEDMGGCFYPHHPLHDSAYITDPLTFVSKLRRLSRSKRVVDVEPFLKGSALRWYCIGLQNEGSHMFDDVYGQFNLDKFCNSLISIFGFPISMEEWVDAKSYGLVDLKNERSDLVEDHAFPALEHARAGGDFRCESYQKVLTKILQSYANDNELHLSDEHNVLKDNKSSLAECLQYLRRFEYESKRAVRIALGSHMSKDRYAPSVKREKTVSPTSGNHVPVEAPGDQGFLRKGPPELHPVLPAQLQQAFGARSFLDAIASEQHGLEQSSTPLTHRSVSKTSSTAAESYMSPMKPSSSQREHPTINKKPSRKFAHPGPFWPSLPETANKQSTPSSDPFTSNSTLGSLTAYPLPGYTPQTSSDPGEPRPYAEPCWRVDDASHNISPASQFPRNDSQDYRGSVYVSSSEPYTANSGSCYYSVGMNKGAE